MKKVCTVVVVRGTLRVTKSALQGAPEHSSDPQGNHFDVSNLLITKHLTSSFTARLKAR